MRYYGFMDGITKRNQAPNQSQNSAGNNYYTQNTTKSLSDEVILITEKDITDEKTREIKYQKRKILRKYTLLSFSLVFLMLISAGSFLIYKTHTVSKKMGNGENSLEKDIKIISSAITNTNKKTLKGEESGRINILLLGAAGKENPGKNLTDTIMIMSIDSKNDKAALLSLPRDLYVQTSKYSTKINSLYQIGLNNNEGIEPLKEIVEKITGLTINYYIVADFAGFKKIIDDIGGINVMVERDIYDPTYPGPNYSYQTFEIKKGLHNLDGETALKYVRERHDDPEGDFGRAKRQQQVIQAVKNKMFSLQTYLNVLTLNKVLNTLGDNIKTDIALDEIQSFIDLSKRVDTQNINNVVVDAWKKDSLLKVSHLMVGGVRAFILVPRIGSYGEIQDVAQNIFNMDAINKRKHQIEKEQASIAIYNESSDARLNLKISEVIKEKLSIKNVRILQSKNKRNDTIVIDNTSSNKIYTLDELIKKIPAVLDSKETNYNQETDFSIVLGEDLIEKYNYEEDSIEDFKNSKNDQEIFNFNKH